MKRSTFKRLNNKRSKEIQEEIFLERLKSLAIEIDRRYFLPNIATIDTYQNPSDVILVSLKRNGKIIPLGKRSKLDPELISKIEEKLNKESEKKKMWFWQRFFMNPPISKKGVTQTYFTNTSVLYEIVL